MEDLDIQITDRRSASRLRRRKEQGIADKPNAIDKDIVVLVAEDEHSHYLLVKYCLKRAGIANEVVWLPDGQKTLDFLLGTGQDTGRDASVRYILLLDIRMPKVDGIDILKQMKQDPELKDIPIIVVTTSREQDLEEKCRQLGCVGHTIKPPNKTLVSTLIKVAEQM
jgi:CheY-like chemotaxis protein